MQGLLVKVQGQLPKGVRIDHIKVEPERGTFELRGPGDPGGLIAKGRFIAGGNKDKG